MFNSCESIFSISYLGVTYGSYTHPTHPGSGGGGASGGEGGSTVRLSIGNDLHVDGSILAKGADASGSSSGGGGSGGSVWISTLMFSGHGTISVNGGAGSGDGFGGAGGRIAVHVSWLREFAGDYLSLGGLGGPNNGETYGGNAACGTIYYTDTNQGLHYKHTSLDEKNNTVWEDAFRKLLLDNQNLNHILPTMIENDNGTDYFEFDELETQNHVTMWLFEQNATLVVHKFVGDRTGLLHLRPGQTMYNEFVESESNISVPPVSVLIDLGAEMICTTTLTLLGTRTTLHGRLTGVQDLYIAEGADVMFTSTATTAFLANGSYVLVTEPGNITFSWLTVQKDSRIDFQETEETFTLTASEFTIKYHGHVHMNRGSIHTGDAVIESEGYLNLNATGYGPETGPGKGWTMEDGIGLGAGHGGAGGAPEPVEGGTAYGSLYQPLYMGSGGGNGGGVGGSGGGVLHWVNGKTLQIDGYLYLAASDGERANAGGGSGGGVLIEVTDFDGHGEINTQGGNAAPSSSGTSGLGFGGSGGRIAIHARQSFLFPGNFQNAGGRNTDGNFGAAGTVYVEETDRGPQYADIKYDKDTNKTYEVADHRYVEVDNEDQHASWIFTMMSEGVLTEWELDEAHVTRHANVRFYHPPNATNVTVIIHKFLGDQTGLVHIREDQKIYVEFVESQNNESITPCSFLIDEGAEIIFPTTVGIQGTRTWLKGLITGVHHLSIIEGGRVDFYSTAQTALLENLQYVDITPKGNFSFATFTVERGSEGNFWHISHPLGLYVSEFRVKYEGQLYMNIAEIESTYAWIESQGMFHMDERGHPAETGPGAGHTTSENIGTGGGHGGQGGGPPPLYGGTPYDSVYTPLHAGSGGGNGTGTGGIGGGYLWWKVAEVLSINGELALRGGNGVGGNAGGGSGGGLLIETTNMTGHGVIDVSGGSGIGRGGGGAAGRAGIHCRWHYTYGGQFIDHGGLGDGTEVLSHGGAGGTFYKEENLRPLEYRVVKKNKVHNNTFMDVDHKFLHSDNDGNVVPPATMIQESGTVAYYFDEMELTGASRLLVYHPDNETEVNITVHLFVGDRTGQLHLMPNQTAFVEVEETATNITHAPCSYIIDNGATIILPTEFHVHGTNSTIRGLIAGVHHIYTGDQANMIFESTTTTALWAQRQFVDLTPPGNLSFATMTVKQGGKMSFLKIIRPFSLESSEIRVKYGGQLYMNEVELFSTYAWIECNGIFHLDGGGRGAETGTGAGFTLNGIGYGAAHGGEGGGVDITQVSQPHGSLFRPVIPGSGGGNGGGVGGTGGGLLHWHIGHYLELNGLLSLKGLDGKNGNAGGGSGGSVIIETTNMTGHGEINVWGGSAAGQGCGGSGGRISILCRWRYTYGGKFVDFGGRGVSPNELSRGAAAGTIYKEENMRPLEYRKSKYIKSLNTTLLVVDHTYLHVDNNGYDVPVATMVLEEYRTDYEFDEMELTGYSRLLIYHPSNETHVTVTAHRFIGDRTGQLHLKMNQTLFAEVVESETNHTEAPCSYIIDYGAEILLPSEVHIHGTRSYLHGIMTGVHDLYVEDEAFLTVTSTAQTALLERQEYIQITSEGNFSVPRLYVKRDGHIAFSRISQDIVVDVAFLEIKYQGLFEMNHGYIDSDHADLESEGVLSLDGRGHGGSTGVGAGIREGTGYGTGASYGGVGGWMSSMKSCSNLWLCLQSTSSW